MWGHEQEDSIANIAKDVGISNPDLFKSKVNPIEREKRHMDPWSLELVIMLRTDKDTWGYGTFQAIIDRRKKQSRDVLQSVSERMNKMNRTSRHY